MTTAHRLPTKPYIRLREQIQQTFDFAYVVCQSVPCLKLQMSLVRKEVISALPKPDYFGKANDLDLIGHQVKEYKSELCRHTILSSFSYFESYVIDVVRDLIKFHGGEDKFHALAVNRLHKTIAEQGQQYSSLKIILQKNKPGELFKIENATKALSENNYVFPSGLFYPLGIKYLSQKIGNLKAADIPAFVRDAFGMHISEDLVEQFHEIREVRNKIAHGDRVDLAIKKVATMNSTLRDFALEIDKHLMRNFFITERAR